MALTKVTGYQLRESIKQWELRKDAATKAFPDSLFKFEGETKQTPERVAEELRHAEAAIASLQVAQMRYNLAVSLSVQGQEMTLAEAIKRAGGASRNEKLWKTADSRSNLSSLLGTDRRRVRSVDEVRAEPTISEGDILEYASAAGKVAGAYRAAIAVANATEVEISLDSTLL